MRGSLKSTGRFGAVLLENLVGFCKFKCCFFVIFVCVVCLSLVLGGGYWVLLVGFIMWICLSFTFQVVILMEFVDLR